MKFDADTLYKTVKKSRSHKKLFIEEIHCPMILKIMYEKGSYCNFCSEVGMGETTFWLWTYEHPIFLECYELGKMIARAKWEEEGEKFKSHSMPLGTIDHAFEYWKMIGWSKYGIGKTSRIRLGLTKDGTPSDHYKQLLSQAGRGDFTASEIKQLMEAINVGLNAHQVFEMQKQLDDLKADLKKMESAKEEDVKHSIAN